MDFSTKRFIATIINTKVTMKYLVINGIFILLLLSTGYIMDGFLQLVLWALALTNYIGILNIVWLKHIHQRRLS